MSEEEFNRELRSIYEELLEQAPAQHRLRTPECPPLPRLSSTSMQMLTNAELDHVKVCTYCQKMLAIENARQQADESAIAAGTQEMRDRNRKEEGSAPIDLIHGGADVSRRIADRHDLSPGWLKTQIILDFAGKAILSLAAILATVLYTTKQQTLSAQQAAH